MEIMENLLYTKDHEWLKVEDDKIYIGITDFAQGELGDIIFVELPLLNTSIEDGGTIATIEAVKTVADVYSPLSGEIIEVNKMIEDKPELSDSRNILRGGEILTSQIRIWAMQAASSDCKD